MKRGVFTHRGSEPHVGRIEGDVVVDLGKGVSVLSEGLSLGHGREVPVSEVEWQLPFPVADYVDFYSSLEHATNLGRILRPGQEPLPPAWRHLPIGYHGRAGSIVPSGTPVRRPCGQRGPSDFGPTRSAYDCQYPCPDCAFDVDAAKRKMSADATMLLMFMTFS